MAHDPTDPAYVAAAVKGTTATNIAFWVLCVAGALIVVGLGRVARVLGVAGFWAYLVVTVAMGLSAALALAFGVMDLLGVTGRSRRDAAKLWEARIVKVAESAGLGLVTWFLYRHFY